MIGFCLSELINQLMKKFILFLILTFVLSCSKKTEDLLCLKIKVIGYDYCSPPTMGAQIVEGPQIGEPYGNYDNVISIQGSDRSKISIDSVLYVQVREVKSNERFIGICLAIYPYLVFSKIQKVLVFSSDHPCN